MRLTWICLLLSAAMLHGQSPSVLLFGRKPLCPDHSTYLLMQGFETPTTGYDNCEAWSLESGSADPVYTGVVLAGTQSLRYSDAGVVVSPIFGTNSEVWVYFLFRPVDIQASSFKAVASLRNEAGSIRWTMTLNAAGTIRMASSGVATTVGTMSEGTTYHVWLHYKDTVSWDVGFSTDGTRPTSGNNFVSLTDLLGGNACRVVMGSNIGAAACDYVADQIRVSNTQIGNNPP